MNDLNRGHRIPVTDGPSLLIDEPDRALRSARIDSRLTSIGSARNCGVVLSSASIAPRHAELRLAKERARIVDLTWRKGLVVRGASRRSAWLRDGDIALLGDVSVTFRSPCSQAPDHVGPQPDPLFWSTACFLTLVGFVAALG